MEVGGKAQNLIELKRLGYNVPDFEVLGYEELVGLVNDSRGLAARLKKVAGNLKSESYAVRSSANVEDSKAASFAGIFTTEIAVRESQLADAVLKVFSTTEDSHKYADTNGVKMSVIIQKYIEARYSGVCFTNLNNSIIINLHQGRGEELVSGKVKAEEIVIARETFTYKQKPIIQFNYSKLVRTFLHIEQDFAAAQDIEFCIDAEDKLWVLQTRPITA